MAYEWFSWTREHMRGWAAELQRSHAQAAREVYERPIQTRHSQLDVRTRGPAPGCPAVVMVQPTQDRKSNYLVACLLSGRNRAPLLRYVLPNPLMWPCLVEGGDITIEHASELLLLQD